MALTPLKDHWLSTNTTQIVVMVNFIGVFSVTVSSNDFYLPVALVAKVMIYCATPALHARDIVVAPLKADWLSPFAPCPLIGWH